MSQVNRSAYPRQIIIDIHSYCNGRCIICPYTALRKKLPMGVMERGLFEKIIDEFDQIAGKNGFKGEVLFCNMGELFVKPKMALDRLRYVLTKKNLQYDIQTNGSLMAPSVTDELLQSGFNGDIVISFHGYYEETYKKIMGVGQKNSLRNINHLIDSYPKDRITLQSIPYDWQRGEAKKLRSYWKERGVRCRLPLPNNRAGLVNRLGNKKCNNLLGCSSDRPLSQMIISFNGDVPLCCNDMAQKEIMGNLGNNSILEVWNGPKMLQVVAQIYDQAPSPDNFLCKRCEHAIFTTSRLYRLCKNINYEARKFFLSYIW